MQKIKLEKLYFNNKWQRPKSKKKFVNKTYENNLISLSLGNSKDIINAISSASLGEKKFSILSNKQKSKILEKISIKIKKNASILAKKEQLELGKDFLNAKKEMIACSNLWKHASKVIKKRKTKIFKKGKIKLLEIYEPVGIVALIVPWNFPMIVLSERLPYILAAGNSVLIKPSEYGSLSIQYFVNLINAVGLPKGTVNFITGDYKTGEQIIKNKSINMVSFTGSTTSGKKIYKSSSDSIKRLSLELGGKNPMVIFRDADLNKSCNDIIYSFTHNAGQCCVSGSRLFVDTKIFNKFIKLMKIKLNKIKNFQSTTTSHQYKKIKEVILKAIKDRIPIIYRNETLYDDKKRIIYPIVFMPKNKKSYLDQEIFGPVLTVNSFKNENILVKEMNDTKFGLSALIWTKNTEKALIIASKIKSGRIWINGNISQNYPDISIGGYKESGMNRETGASGINTYSEIKSIIINK